VKAADKMGNISLDPKNAPDSVYSFMVTGTGIEEGYPESKNPKSFSLSQNYPNPFNPSTRISFKVPGDSAETLHVSLLIYDIRGKLVRELIHSDVMPGSHVVSWNGNDEKGDQVPSGVYFYRVKAGDFTATRKMTLIR
jgi:flagellar hook assembly protein FlgD